MQKENERDFIDTKNLLGGDIKIIIITIILDKLKKNKGKSIYIKVLKLFTFKVKKYLIMNCLYKG